jgi:hypothetical protein
LSRESSGLPSSSRSCPGLTRRREARRSKVYRLGSRCPRSSWDRKDLPTFRARRVPFERRELHANEET